MAMKTQSWPLFLFISGYLILRFLWAAFVPGSVAPAALALSR